MFNRQPDEKPRRRGRKKLALLTLALVALIIGAIVYVSLTKRAPGVAAYALPCAITDDVRAFGGNIVYYDGMTLHCLNTKGREMWSCIVGKDADFSTSESNLIAWNGNQIFLFDKNGNSTYNDMLEEEIQFARAGESYVAVVVGSADESSLMFKDLAGNHIDTEAGAFTNTMLLDCGFYGVKGVYLWALSIDVETTEIETTLSTFEVGRMNTGMAYLGAYIPYELYEENGKLRMLDTRSLRTFSLTATEEPARSILMYGWQLVERRALGKGSALLMRPTVNSTDYTVSQLRLINGSQDQRLNLPTPCYGALLGKKAVYGIGETMLYRCALSQSRFTAHAIPINGPCTDYICSLDGDACVVASGEKLYCLTLP